jgi:hypothetical protein
MRAKLKSDESHWLGLSNVALIAIVLAGCASTRSVAQPPGQKTFPSAEDASNALVMAIQSNDEKATLEILGPDGKNIVSSGAISKTPITGRTSFRNIRKCTAWRRIRRARLSCTSAHGIGLRPYRW